ncbi:MAG: membrane protein insertase YidC [Oscillospiraceae bacterium]|jgi:YidC/Oxa1 family membrane protein insertase|nr:membrane protein insertase YidC [Oscillospiraceae bacterium]
MGIQDIIIWPFAKLLLLFNEWSGNYGVALILFALLLTVIFLPFRAKSKRSMMRSAKLTPLMKELEKKYEGDKVKYQEAVGKLYKQEGINPMSGCLWSFLPLVFILMIYRIIRLPLTVLMNIGEDKLAQITEKATQLSGGALSGGAYEQLEIVRVVSDNFDQFRNISDKLIPLNFNFLGLNLGDIPTWQVWKIDFSDPKIWLPALGLFLIPLISAGLNYVAMMISTKTNPAQAATAGSMKMMNMLMPLMSLWICFTVPALLGVYWIANSMFNTAQDFALTKYYFGKVEAEDAERRARLKAQEDELERKRLETERLRALGETERNRNTSKKKLQAAEKNKTEERLAREKAQERAKRRAALGLTDEQPASQVGNRRFARGRAYVEDRFINPEDAEEQTRAAAELSELDEAADREVDEAADREVDEQLED